MLNSSTFFLWPTWLFIVADMVFSCGGCGCGRYGLWSIWFVVDMVCGQYGTDPEINPYLTITDPRGVELFENWH